MQVLYSGMHIEFVSSVLIKMGYTQSDLRSNNLYPCLIRLISEDTVKDIEAFLFGKMDYLKQTLQSHGLDAFIYLLQEFISPITWSTNPKKSLNQLFEDAQDLLNKEIGSGVIRMGIE
ncbi:hypothetical protein VCSRO121_3455 [Vibrio cholerae]|nr:hypothetical protein VCSRO121_3455 [Vibrio cholerae]